MSFAMTTEQVLNKSKFVTRRFGWLFLKPGDKVQPVKKAMGLKKGDKIQKIGGPITVVSVRLEPLNSITQEDVILEGFPDFEPNQFVDFLMQKYKLTNPAALVNRIEFAYEDK